MTTEIINNVLNHVDTWVWYYSVVRPLLLNIDVTVVVLVIFGAITYMFKYGIDWEKEKVKMGHEEENRQRNRNG